MSRLCALGLLLATAACNGEKEGNGGKKDGDGLPPASDPVDLDEDGVLSDTDCNDGDAGIFPGASETCNGLDDDCNGTIDDGLIETFYRDWDRDGFGNADEMAEACAQPAGFVSDSSDCDDGSSAVHPGGTEVCDLVGVDEDCNSMVNEDDPGLANIRTWFVDGDEDGFGSDKTTEACFEAPGLATIAGDCNDSDFDMNPAAVEVCDSVDKDEDCDGFGDVSDPEGPFGQPLYYIDTDSDGDGDASDPGQYFCDGVPAGYSTLGSDCDDTIAIINPQAPENCRDLVDNDCNGAVDDCGPIPDITLDTADVRLEGATSYTYNGAVVSGVGDMNGDDQADFATGAWQYSSGTGGVFLFYGPAPVGTHETEDVVDAIIEGKDMWGQFGWSLDKAGDVNSDGFDDMIVGQQFCCSGSAGFVFLGPIYGDMEASGADAIWKGENDDMAGMLVAGDFDVDGDGNSDYLIGSDRYDASSTYSDEGRLFLVYGPGTGSNELVDAPATFTGSFSYENFGMEATGLPDVNGDGADEILAGVQSMDSQTGKAMLFYGASFSGDTLDTEADTTISGTATYDFLGARTSRANDFNNDGYGDFLVSAFQADTGTYGTGSVYVILGPADADGTADSLAQAEFYGEYSYEQIGRDQIDGEMDVNRDGYTDVLISAPDTSSSTYGTGTAYLFYGPQTGDVSVANARCAMTGTVAGEQASSGLSFIGDQSGDDSPEVLIGAPYATSSAGNVYVVFGDRL
jgi:hypothetical protein